MEVIESILEFYLGYEQIFKFDVWNGFLGLENKTFETFKTNYSSRKGYMFGDKKNVGLKELSRMKKEDHLSKLFDLEILSEVENKFIEEENNMPTGISLILESQTMNLRFTELYHRESLTPKFQKKILKSELIQWKSQKCKKYLEVKAQILKRLEEKLKTICSLHEQLSEKFLQLSDIFRELDFQETAIQFKVKHGFGWKEELQNFTRDCALGKGKPQQNAWQFGVKMSKQWSIFQKISALTVEREMGLPTHLLRKTGESLADRAFLHQESINAEYIYEQKKLRLKKKKLLKSKGVKDWGVCESVQRRDKVIRGLEKGERWGWGLMCWERSSLMRHFKGLFETSNSATFLQMENLQMLENSMFVHRFQNIKNSLQRNFRLLTEF